MLTFTTLKSTYATLTDSSSNNETFGAQMINDSVRTICNLRGGRLRFLEDTANLLTVADQETYQIPNKFRKIIDMYIYSGSGSASDTIYAPEMIFDPMKWKLIKQYRLGTSNVPYFTYVERTKFSVQPIPSTSNLLMVLRGRLNVRDMNIADYTTGGILTATADGLTLVGTGTSWTADMAGSYIRITNTLAANGGDGFWYPIASVTNTTTLVLEKPYGGTAIAAGNAAYTIGQVSPIPEAYQMAIVYRAVALYWENKNDLTKAKTYWLKYDGGNEAGYNKEYGGIIGQMLENEYETEEGSYVPPFGSTNNIVSAVPYWFPWQQATGFN